MKFTYKAEELVESSPVRRTPNPVGGAPYQIGGVAAPGRQKAGGLGRWLALAAIALVVVAGGVGAWKLWRGGGYARNSASIVLFGARGSGASGFIVRDGSSVWLYTNRHVVEAIAKNPSSWSAYLIDGSMLKFSLREVEIAADRDLARFPVKDCKVPGLRIAMRAPVKDEPIVILGNSQAEGVITEAKGRVLGYGPTEIEHDADTAPGNSGSPVIDSEGFVIAVDTRGKAPDGDRGLLKDSRYKANRNFGERIVNVPWLKISDLEKVCGRGSAPQATAGACDAGDGDGTGSDDANVTAASVKAAREYLTPSDDEIRQLAVFVVMSPFVSNTPSYSRHLLEVPFEYIATNNMVNAVARRLPAHKDGKLTCVYKTDFYGGAARYARLIGLAYSQEASGKKGALARFIASMPRRMCARCSEEDALAMMRRGGLFKVFADSEMRQKAISFSSGTIASVIAHEMGHHALGHMGRIKNLSNEIERNQEREADSFASSVLSSSPYGEYIFAGTLYWFYALAIQGDGESDAQSNHPLSRERFQNFVRANREKAAALGIVLE